MARQRPFDVILLDLRLPDGDGCAFVPRLLSSAGGRADTPVIAVSAHALAADQQRALDVGCCAFIEKPIDVASFVDRIEALASTGD
jgi:CheY-like chemotaxis protein